MLCQAKHIVLLLEDIFVLPYATYLCRIYYNVFPFCKFDFKDGKVVVVYIDFQVPSTIGNIINNLG